MEDIPFPPVLTNKQKEGITYNITYKNVDGLENPNPTEYSFNKNVKLEPVLKNGYAFKGWFTSPQFEPSTEIKDWEAYEMTSDLVLYAKFEETGFNINTYGISNLADWLNSIIDTNRNDNKVKISGTANITTSDLRTLSSEVKKFDAYIGELDFSDLNVTQFYNSGDGSGGDGFLQQLNNVKKMKLPSSLKILSEGAFAKCSNLEEVELNEGLTDILWSALSRCSKLKKVTIPDSVEFIAQTAFYECTSLEKVSISKNSNLEIIGLNAFKNCNKLTEFYFPPKITHLDNRGATTSRQNTYGYTSNPGSFYLCSGLTTLTFSKNIKKINNQVFEGCNKITTINFEGTPEEWAAVQIGSNNGSLLSATVNYNYVIQ